MSVVQVWLLIGVPVLLGAVALYTARSPALSALGVLLTLAAAVGVTAVDRASGAVLGVLAVLLYAAGSAGRAAVVGDDPVRGRGQGDATSA
ncbi:MAG TPA: hypothetical protein VK923_02190 [Euzebyales bacterium]|nr:hypothetical protein [Euzebyales bacterium]